MFLDVHIMCIRKPVEKNVILNGNLDILQKVKKNIVLSYWAKNIMLWYWTDTLFSGQKRQWTQTVWKTCTLKLGRNFFYWALNKTFQQWAKHCFLEEKHYNWSSRNVSRYTPARSAGKNLRYISQREASENFWRKKSETVPPTPHHIFGKFWRKNLPSPPRCVCGYS